jgi:hypothetical protein
MIVELDVQAAGLAATVFLRRFGMKSVWKPLYLFAVIALVVVTAFAYVMLPQAPPLILMRPIISVCVVMVMGYAAIGAGAFFTKRHTAATGF